ncbi:MAG: fructosamine kinase family protein [Bacteroidales bacterium]|nr:fructosamine kinase family protein [Bacteroidales bacterium]NLK81202.1 fructosamine kinase family protein [Bacteroidales bacterium]HPY82461.1 fructosamine kinase family protein [Bacteroidales bacterium]
MIPNSIHTHIEERYGTITAIQSIGGGCIANTYKITFGNIAYFLKCGNLPNDMFIKEADGLQEIANSKTILCPKIIEFNSDFLLLDFIEQGKRNSNFFTDFGKNFALMHKHTADYCGFYEDNYIGATVQKNTQLPSWTDFYFENRIVFQLKCMEKKGLPTAELRAKITKLESQISNILLGSDDAFSLLHGDLWHGNFLVHANGEACVIDPAVYYGNREADLAMTKLFGGFPTDFYTAYSKEFPLPEGYEYREGIYRLYHIMNHYTLFGGSYYQQAIAIINQYI